MGPTQPAPWRLHFCGIAGPKAIQRCRESPDCIHLRAQEAVRNGFVLLGEGQSAISDRVGAAHGISNPKAIEQRFGSGPPAPAPLPRLTARRRFTQGALFRRVQIALKPTSKTLGLHGVFMRSKGLKDLIADSALNICKSTSEARAGSMLTSIISALHRGQAGRPIAANGMTDDRG